MASFTGWYDGADRLSVAMVSPSDTQTAFQPVLTRGSPVRRHTFPEGAVRVITPGPDPTNGDHNFVVHIEPATVTTEPVSRAALATALLAVLAAWLLFRVATSFGASRASAALVTAIFACAPLTWKLATTPEVFAGNVCIALAIVWFIHTTRIPAVPPATADGGNVTRGAEQILAERLARGDINPEEYRERLKALTT